MDADDTDRMEQDFSSIAVALFASGTVDATLKEIVRLAQASIRGCDAAGILVVDDADAPRTLCATSELAERLDGAQIAAGEGPCLDAARSGTTFWASDLHDDARWPSFTPIAVDAGIRSVLAFSISAAHLSALNLYATLPGAFGVNDRAEGQLFATLARLALDSAETHAAHDLNASGLREAMRTRELIGQAQGILMERERVTADQAFDLLRRASQHLNIKLRELAASLVETGEAPDAGEHRA